MDKQITPDTIGAIQEGTIVENIYGRRDKDLNIIEGELDDK
jgi:hypothetical protein